MKNLAGIHLVLNVMQDIQWLLWMTCFRMSRSVVPFFLGGGIFDSNLGLQNTHYK